MNEKMQESLAVAHQQITLELTVNAALARSGAVYAQSNCVDTNFNKLKLREFLMLGIGSNKNTLAGGIWFEPYVIYDDNKYYGPFVYKVRDVIRFAPEYSSGAYDYHNDEWYLNGVNSGGALTWTGTYIDPVTNSAMITATMPFYGEDGKMWGVATADMALDSIKNLAASLSVGQTGRAIIIGRDGEYLSLFGEEASEEEDESVVLDELADRLMREQSGITNIYYNGTERRVYSMKMPEVGWTLAIAIDEQEITASTRERVILISIVPLIGLGLAAVAIFLVARHFKRVAGKVNSFAARAAAGHFDERLTATEADEFGTMERNLNRMMENMSEMYDEAQAGSRAKGEFLARMSHEIRTPINAILGMSQIAERADDESVIRDCLSKIDTACKQLIALVNNILDMAKIEAGKLEVCRETFNLPKTLENVCAVMAVKLDEKNQPFELDIAPDISDWYEGDALRLSQVINNLLSNANKFTPVGFGISLTVTMVSEDARGCLLRFVVRDRGIGMTQDQLAKLFTSFEQADGSISRRFGGTGLGLAISKQIVELMGGEFEVTSVVGEGSSFAFTVRMPRTQAAEEQSESDDAASEQDGYDFTEVHALLAEDIDLNREIVAALLEDTGIKIDMAENGRIAVDMVRDAMDDYDLIMMDIHMPEMDGYEAARQIRMLGYTRPIVAMTANAFTEDVRRCLDAGMNDHIAKPVEAERLMSTIRRLLDGNAKK